MVQSLEPENVLDTSQPSIPQNANDGTFIQNITNNYILDKKKNKLVKKEELEKDGEKPVDKEPKQCHCHLSKHTQAQFGGPMGYPQPPHYYPYYQYPGYYNPYMAPYGMQMPPYGYPPHFKHPEFKEERSRSRSPVAKELRTNMSNVS